MPTGSKGGKVKWITEDVTEWQPSEPYDAWRDRATFHFLMSEKEQHAYIRRLKQAARACGRVIVGTFAPEGPEKRSGLPIARHSAETLSPLLGADFIFLTAPPQEHITPSHTVQMLQFGAFRRIRT